MTNNEHNEKILAEICSLQEQIKELQAEILPADELPEVDLLMCNSGALAARAEKFSQKAQVKAVIEEVMGKAEPAKKAKKDAAKA